MRRRALLAGVAALGAPAAFAQTATPPAPPPAPVPQPAKRDDTVSGGYNRFVIARWGDPVLPNAPDFTPAAPTGDEADTQLPYDAVIAALVAPPAAQDGIARYVLVTANPTAPARMVFPPNQDHPDIAGRLQGVTVQNLQYQSGRWVSVDGGYQTRRLNDGTLCQITGPASAAVGSSVLGVLGVQAGCASPLGTVLLAEGDAAPWLARLGLSTSGAPFGWVVELNPLDPVSIPAKRTALGRVARAGIAAAATADGRQVVFFTQDDVAGYLFRFIAATPATDGSALDSGALAVAKVNGQGIDWVALGGDVPTMANLASAAAVVGGSVFDAPGGLAISSGHDAVYLACAGNVARILTDALNPRPGNDDGHVVRFTPPDGDLTAAHFSGVIALLGGASTTGTWLRKPRWVGLDPAGRLWISTDQNGDTSATADGLFVINGSLLETAYFAPIGAALGGAAFDAATNTIFAAVRHPGATPSASYNFPATRWPTLEPNMPPQTTLIALVPGA